MRDELIVQSKIQNVSSLNTLERGQMFALMTTYFDEVNEGVFMADLSAKNWAILLKDGLSGRILGFSTLAIMEASVDGKKIKAFYSGDTIIDDSCRRLFSLERDWVPFVFSHVASEPGPLWYWFMVCKGFRTYRYLPVYFKKFWPSPEEAIPSFEQKVVHHLARARFGDYYDPQSGLVKVPSDYRLKQGVGEPAGTKLNNRHIRFFLESNPGWRQGDELACLVPLQREYLHKKAQGLIPGNPGAENAQ